MAIGNSKLHSILRRRRLLYDSVVWYDAFKGNLRHQILDWIRLDQLRDKGVDADGDVIGYYSLTTSFIDPRKKFNTHFTLNDSGDFYRLMFLAVLADRLVFNSSSNSYQEIKDQNWFSERILNLTDENLDKLKEEIKKKYIQAVKKALFKH